MTYLLVVMQEGRMRILLSDLVRKKKAVTKREDAYFFIHQNLLTMATLLETETLWGF